MTKKSAFQKIKEAVSGKPIAPVDSTATENSVHSEHSGNSEAVAKQAALGVRPNAYTEALNKARKPLTKAVDNSERDEFANKRNNGTAAE